MCYNFRMTQIVLDTPEKAPGSVSARFNSPSIKILWWLAKEQAEGHLYSRRQLLRMPRSIRKARRAPPFSRLGMKAALNDFENRGTLVVYNKIYQKLVVAGQPLPPGASSFL